MCVKNYSPETCQEKRKKNGRGTGNKKLDSPVYIIKFLGKLFPSEGFELMMHFIGNLYGMVQASRQFWMLLRDYMVDVNKGAFAQLWSDPCVFYKMVDGELMIVWTYVDDLGALVVKDTMWHTFYRDISSVFEVEETEVSWFLGMHVEHGEGWTTMDMTKYINDKLIIYNLQDANHADTPMALKFAEDKGPPLNQDQLHLYKSMCAAGIWIQHARPDITQAINHWCGIPHPTIQDLSGIKRVWRYLAGSINLKLTFSKENGEWEATNFSSCKSAPNAYCIVQLYGDANLAQPKSTTAFAAKVGGGCFISKSKRQQTTALHTYDSEYVAQAYAFMYGMWITMGLWELNPFFGGKLIQGPMMCNCDNEAVLKIIRESAISSKVKHILLKLHFVLGVQEDGWIHVRQVVSANNVSDLQSKPLPPMEHWRMALDQLGLQLFDKPECKG